jgi:hypothetical protein
LEAALCYRPPECYLLIYINRPQTHVAKTLFLTQDTLLISIIELESQTCQINPMD